jgi:hypothetical protein
MQFCFGLAFEKSIASQKHLLGKVTNTDNAANIVWLRILLVAGTAGTAQ